MKNKSINLIFTFLLVTGITTSTIAAPVTRAGSGANAAAIQAAVDQFRADFGGPNNGVGGSFKTGRREINWDGVPDNSSAPSLLAPNFFNLTSPRGIVFFNPGNSASPDSFQVSADAGSGVAIDFGNLDPSYTAIFQPFSAERLFTPRLTNVTEIEFFIPGTSIPATVKGFGAVFADVDGVSNTFMKFYGPDGVKLASSSVPPSNNGLSFVGISFNAGERIAKVIIQTGNEPLSAGVVDGVNGADLVVMDDFIYGEPRAMQSHPADFDGDGFSDINVFRPATGEWFHINSGSNTLEIVQWGQNGDVPIDGDFDGDGMSDRVVFRPADGTWWLNRTTAGVIAAAFGSNGDKPVAGDYDKDGKADIAVWRPSTGNYLVARSSTNFTTFFGAPFGQLGDIPVQAAGQ